MKYKKIQFVVIILVFIIYIFSLNNITYASLFSNVINGGDNFTNAADLSVTVDQDKLKDTSNDIYNMLLTIAIVTSIVVGMIIGIKLMTTEAENKAEAKKSLIVFFVGCVIVFGAFGIWKALVTFLNTF